MDTLTLTQDNEQDVIEKAVRVLKNGGVIVYPTDTVYGLGADALNENAVRRLFALKKRPFHKPVPLFVESVEMAKDFAFVDSKNEKILRAVWPGVVTLVLHKKDTIPSVVSGGGDTVGLRIPDSPFCIRLVHMLGSPICGTSANISGEQSSSSLAPILAQFKTHARIPDLVIDAGNLGGHQPSTVLDLTGPQPKILRIGPATPEQIKNILAIS